MPGSHNYHRRRERGGVTYHEPTLHDSRMIRSEPNPILCQLDVDFGGKVDASEELMEGPRRARHGAEERLWGCRPSRDVHSDL